MNKTTIIEQKAAFLENGYIAALKNLDPMAAGAWGKMNVQGMAEHMSDSFRIANGKDPKDCDAPPENIERMQAFLRSDKPFKENTKNAHMADEPEPLRWHNMDDALGELQTEIADFFDVFNQDRDKTITNPFFGDLNYEDWVLLLYKHAMHHLRQFGSQIPSLSYTGSL